VSHELRTPLTSISASLGLLIAKKGDDLPVQVTHLISIAHANSQRLVRLVNDILDIEKMEARQIAFDFVWVGVRTQVEQAIESSQGFAEACGVRILLHSSGDAVDDVWADPGRLIQVVTNLLSNAIKFSAPDTEVEVAIENGPHDVRISVRDHGPGISADFRPRVFERFAQADATDTRLRGGTGLGLSIVMQIVDRLGGKVGFSDAPGGGTVFQVELPSWRSDVGAIGHEAQLEALMRMHRELGRHAPAASPKPAPAESSAAEQDQAISA
jgi:signal transduction histidine kinase